MGQEGGWVRGIQGRQGLRWGGGDEVGGHEVGGHEVGCSDGCSVVGRRVVAVDGGARLCEWPMPRAWLGYTHSTDTAESAFVVCLAIKCSDNKTSASVV